MPRTKQSVENNVTAEINAKKKILELQKEIKDLKDNTVQIPLCLVCGKNGKPSDFYNTSNTMYAHNNFKLPLCKDCMEKEFGNLLVKYGDQDLALYYLCREVNVYFGKDALQSAKTNSLKTGMTLLQSYMKQLNSLNTSLYGDSFLDSSNFLDIERIEEQLKENGGLINDDVDVDDDEINCTITEFDEQNRKDCIRLLRYDPFSEDDKVSRKFLYNTLIEYLDEATLEDPFKLSSTITIVRIFGQIDTIDKSLSKLMCDMDENSNKITSLVNAKKNLQVTATQLAKENNISVANASNKSSGAGTLSGILKKLNEMDLDDAKVNKFDIDTCDGFRQVAEISDEAIFRKLNLREDDLTDMLKELRAVRIKQDEELIKLKEENRVLKLKIKDAEER